MFYIKHFEVGICEKKVLLPWLNETNAFYFVVALFKGFKLKLGLELCFCFLEIFTWHQELAVENELFVD